MFRIIITLIIINANFNQAYPLDSITRSVSENNHFDDNFDNYLPKFGELPKFEYSADNKIKPEEILFKSHLDENQTESASTITPKSNIQKITGKQITKLVQKLSELISTTKKPETTTTFNFNIIEETTTNEPSITTTEYDLANVTLSSKFNVDQVFENSGSDFNDTSRVPRQEFDVVNGTSNGTSIDVESENQEDEESEEEDENMVTGLISSFLGGLSRPDGSVDVEAITGLLGSLSTQNMDGTYDFSGVTELLMSFFGGGDEEGGGGSDLGAFVGGLVGAVLKGSANPPGGKGVGIFTGKVVAGVLPALSGPAPAKDDDAKPSAPAQPLDSGGFLGGFLSTVLGALGGLSGNGGSSGSGGDNSGGGGHGGGSKFSIFKLLFSAITSVFSASSKQQH